MVRRRASAVSNHEAPLVAYILRDAASRLLRMRGESQDERIKPGLDLRRFPGA
jgi:hypothetical protein